jgi:hypothetical protein
VPQTELRCLGIQVFSSNSWLTANNTPAIRELHQYLSLEFIGYLECQAMSVEKHRKETLVEEIKAPRSYSGGWT